MRPIDADELIKNIDEYAHSPINICKMKIGERTISEDCIAYINNAPTIDVISIDKLCEIMVEIFETPCDVLSYKRVDSFCENAKYYRNYNNENWCEANGKDCWKKFFKHCCKE